MNVLPDAQGLNRVPPELPLRLAHVLRYAPQPERALNALRLDKETPPRGGRAAGHAE